jgi:type III secretory pathway component EscS
MTTEDCNLAWGHIEKLLDRRLSITSFYLSVNAAIATVIGLLVKDAQLQQELLPFTILLLIAAGLGACWIWRSLIKQYERLLDWWYARLRELESAYPDSARLITREYQDLYAPDKSSKRTIRLGMTQRELALNWIFIGLYLVFGVGIILSLLF